MKQWLDRGVPFQMCVMVIMMKEKGKGVRSVCVCVREREREHYVKICQWRHEVYSGKLTSLSVEHASSSLQLPWKHQQ